MSDDVIAYVAAMNGDTDEARLIPPKENQSPATAPDEPHETEPDALLFAGETHKHYFRHKKKLNGKRFTAGDPGIQRSTVSIIGNLMMLKRR
jgi:hypothetical protein